MIKEDGIIAYREGVILRLAIEKDFPQIDEITILCYTNIQKSYVEMLGLECYERVRHNPELTWEERKTRQNPQLYAEHPEWVWVLVRFWNNYRFCHFLFIPGAGLRSHRQQRCPSRFYRERLGKVHVSACPPAFQK